MPISDRASAAVLTSLPAATWTQLSAVPTPQEHGFDHLDVVWICDFRGVVVTALDVANAFPQGARYGTADFWLRSGVPERVAANIWTFKAHYEGRISIAKPDSVRMQSSNQIFSIDSLTYAGYTDTPFQVRDANATVQIGYVLVGSPPPTVDVGTAGTPSHAPLARAGFWSTIAAKRVNWPNGWVLSDVDADEIAGASPVAFWVLESWEYVQEFLPS